MNSIQFLQLAQDELHRSLRGEVRDLTQEQFIFRPTADANSIAFLLWHFMRSEDNSIHNLVPGAGPSVWESGHWDERLGQELKASGGLALTGEQVGSFRPDKDELLGYLRAVWDASDAAIASLSESDLDRPFNPERPQVTVAKQLQSLVVGHGYSHLGEIRFLKGLQGMPFVR